MYVSDMDICEQKKYDLKMYMSAYVAELARDKTTLVKRMFLVTKNIVFVTKNILFVTLCHLLGTKLKLSILYLSFVLLHTCKYNALL